MKVSEIHKTFKVMMDKNAEAVAFGGCPAFLPEEIDLFLNQAYIEVISNKFTGSNAAQIGFEGSVKRIQDLEKLVKTDTLLSLVGPVSNVLTLNDFFSTGGNYNRMFYVTSVLHFGDNSSTCILIDHNDARRFLKTYNNNPWIDTPVSTLEDNKLNIYIDMDNMAIGTGESYKLTLTYVKYPEKIDHTTPNVDINEVPDRIMTEVINRAVVLALENIESNRAQTKLQINNLQE